MDPNVPEDVRREVAAWLAEHFDPELPVLGWRGLLADSGWGAPAWPLDWYGRGLPADVAGVVAEEFERVGAVGPSTTGAGAWLVAPTILVHGTDEQKRRHLRPILTGEDKWCQLFSEPGNGSDLAGLTTRAERDGDEWVVSGQKVWTTGARFARYGLLLARTDWDVPKHRGITCFVLPMGQPGVEVRPLRQMNGHASFNEVFLDAARVPADHLLGDVHEGWTVARTTLTFERGAGAGPAIGARRPKPGRTATEATEDAEELARSLRWYPQRAGRADLVVPQAKASGRAVDPVVRAAAADVVAHERMARWNAERARVALAGGRPPGPEGSLGKLAASDLARRCASTHAEIAGAHGMLSGEDGPLGGLIPEIIVSVPGHSIAGGTDEIQRNILAERVLDLPREHAVDEGVAFCEVRTNAPGRRT
ncbi:MAG TPA: acyl-CoA dehydrogenase family protein [Acidimicrobiales bacterium]|nr:acyl-CoA dehydrogenase family protein [Acidimicrobiales bacterium]